MKILVFANVKYRIGNLKEAADIAARAYSRNIDIVRRIRKMSRAEGKYPKGRDYSAGTY